MKKLNKKGFTIVELVIVIAVIAILSAVLIPTFTSIVSNAKDTAAISNAQAAYKQYLATDDTDIENASGNFVFIDDGRYVAIKNGNVVADANGNEVFESEEDALANFDAVDDPATDDVENTVSLADTATADGLYAVKSVYVAAEG